MARYTLLKIRSRKTLSQTVDGSNFKNFFLLIEQNVLDGRDELRFFKPRRFVIESIWFLSVQVSYRGAYRFNPIPCTFLRFYGFSFAFYREPHSKHSFLSRFSDDTVQQQRWSVIIDRIGNACDPVRLILEYHVFYPILQLGRTNCTITSAVIRARIWRVYTRLALPSATNTYVLTRVVGSFDSTSAVRFTDYTGQQ